MSEESRLEDVWFMGGGSQRFYFNVVGRNDESIDLQDSTITWTLSEIGQKETPLVIKDNKTIGGVVTTETVGECIVDIDYSDSIYLSSNKYEHELTIIQKNGKVLRPSYGYITIRKGSEYSL